MGICTPEAVVLFACFAASACFAVEAWKDQWLLSFEKSPRPQSLSSSVACQSSILETNCVWRLPRHSSPRKNSTTSQLIPRVIFQTWKSYDAAGSYHYKAVTSFIVANPEYDYYLFDDAAALAFMRKFYPEHVHIYQQILPGAMKADIWRLAVIYKYGGVYVDSDSHSVTPLREVIWHNASVVTGIGAVGDFHQWALIYTPRHVFIKSALKVALQRTKALYHSRVAGHITKTTGPAAFHVAVSEVLAYSRCALPPDFRTRYKTNAVIHYLPAYQCSPEVGVLQIFNGDYLGGNVIFKDPHVEGEKNLVSAYYKGAEKRYDTLFKTTVIADASTPKPIDSRTRIKSKQPPSSNKQPTLARHSN